MKEEAGNIAKKKKKDLSILISSMALPGTLMPDCICQTTGKGV